MIEWVGTHWFWITVYWLTSFTLILRAYEKWISDKGYLTKKEVFFIFLLSPLFPWVMGAILIGQFIKAGKGSDDT